jgi:arabinose-5-phosphate isomerase
MLVLGDAGDGAGSPRLRQGGFRSLSSAGRLGRALLLKVHQIMRGEDQFAKVLPDTPIVEVIKGMTSRRGGAAVVVNPAGTLESIFTHGDFARPFPLIPDIGTCPVGDFMTRKPITISGDKLAAEVLRVLQKHRIDDIVVVDGAKRPIGVVDSQDLSRLKIL